MVQAASERDNRILQLIFDPESAPLPQLNIGTKDDQRINPEKLRRSKVMEREAVRAAESGNTQEGLRLLDQAISVTPIYSSLFNNRAQVHRLRNEIPAAVEDVTTAISLATPVPASRPISSIDAKVLSQAHTHRASLLRLYISPEPHLTRVKGRRLPPPRPEMLEGWTREKLVEVSNEDLELGARYGNDLARAIRVAENPYAQMCSAIVATALRGERA